LEQVRSGVPYAVREIGIEELLVEVFSVRRVPRCYKQDKSSVELVVRQSPASEDVKRKLRKIRR
jgi:hypothetical protein